MNIGITQYLAINLAYSNESLGKSMKTRDRAAKKTTTANINGTNIVIWNSVTVGTYSGAGGSSPYIYYLMCSHTIVFASANVSTSVPSRTRSNDILSVHPVPKI